MNIAIAINSMIVSERKFEETFELAEIIQDRFKIKTYVDLRSKRSPKTDIGHVWDMAYNNSSFDILNEDCVQKAINISKDKKIDIIATSVYLGAGYNNDFNYGKNVIRCAHRLADASPYNTIIVRITGGNANFTNIKEFKNVAVNNIIRFAEYACDLKKIDKNRKNSVMIGVEVHQGQYPQTVQECIEIFNHFTNLPKSTRMHLGLIEDPTNRYIATCGSNNFISPFDAARELTENGCNIIYYHIKDVKICNHKVNIKEDRSGFQIVGMEEFKFKDKYFMWELPNDGLIDLRQTILAANIYGRHPNKIIAFSTEHVPGSRSKEDAKHIALKYGKEIYNIINFPR